MLEQKKFVFCLSDEYFEYPGHQPVPLKPSKTTQAQVCFSLGEFITLTVSHDCFIEMKPKVALQLAGSSEL